MTSVAVSIGDIVEVFCDHKRSGRRVRDWVEGVVVHADDRMTAIQFRNDVYLTDGWMVPDRILWFNKGSVKIRLAKKSRGAAVSTKPRPVAPERRRKNVAPERKPVRSSKK
ncbi:MAG: hypothetical protein JW748_07290 [Anaerolineales bacterium]|nr:hypothetical protein [Anaerolineales bacterium]